MAEAQKNQNQVSEAAAEKPKRARVEKLEAAPLGLRLPPAPPLTENGTRLNAPVRLGWLRRFVASVPKSMPDDCAVHFESTHTEVRP